MFWRRVTGARWGEVDNTLIKVKVGEKLRRIMPEYVPKTAPKDGER
jgi:hypothetical protein